MAVQQPLTQISYTATSGRMVRPLIGEASFARGPSSELRVSSPKCLGGRRVSQGGLLQKRGSRVHPQLGAFPPLSCHGDSPTVSEQMTTSEILSKAALTGLF